MTLDIPLPPAAATHIRRLDMYKDLTEVADLVELCFYDTLDPEGRNYLRQMRKTANSTRLLAWAGSLADEAALPPSGLVWEEQGKIIGNLSLIPINVLGRRCYLIANVAVHPERRNRGIGQQLTQAALEVVRTRNAPSAWLQVREDNPGAVHIYKKLGFKERARRTSWYTSADIPHTQLPAGVKIGPRRANVWGLQREWLMRLYPQEFAWHLPIQWSLVRPDVWGMAYRLFTFEYPRQWVVFNGASPLGMLTWKRSLGYADQLWLAVPPEPDETAVLGLLGHARRSLLHTRPLALNLPAGLADGAIRESGFAPHQTLLWMQYGFI